MGAKILKFGPRNFSVRHRRILKIFGSYAEYEKYRGIEHEHIKSLESTHQPMDGFFNTIFQLSTWKAYFQNMRNLLQ